MSHRTLNGHGFMWMVPIGAKVPRSIHPIIWLYIS